MYLITPEKKHGYIGELIKNNKTSLFVFWIDNETQLKRFRDGCIAENPQELFEIIDAVVKHENRKRISGRVG